MNLFEARNVTMRFGANPVLRNVSISMQAGEIVTIVGPNGSGKSTFLRALIGSLEISDGSIVRQDGLRFGYVPQKLHIDPTLPLTVNRFMRLARRSSRSRVQFTLESVGIVGLLDHQVSGLSGGQLQRLMLARALLSEPHLLVLDEPTQGLDQRGTAAFYRQIDEVRQISGCGVLMVSHDLHVVMSASDRVICLDNRICCQGAPHQVASAPEYQALFGDGTQGALALYPHRHHPRATSAKSEIEAAE